jgi:hypothetical protein
LPSGPFTGLANWETGLEGRRMGLAHGSFALSATRIPNRARRVVASAKVRQSCFFSWDARGSEPNADARRWMEKAGCVLVGREVYAGYTAWQTSNNSRKERKRKPDSDYTGFRWTLTYRMPIVGTFQDACSFLSSRGVVEKPSCGVNGSGLMATENWRGTGQGKKIIRKTLARNAPARDTVGDLLAYVLGENYGQHADAIRNMVLSDEDEQLIPDGWDGERRDVVAESGDRTAKDWQYLGDRFPLFRACYLYVSRAFAREFTRWQDKGDNAAEYTMVSGWASALTRWIVQALRPAVKPGPRFSA